MAELALAVVGVVPVLVSTIKGFKYLRSCLRTARRCVKELRELEVDFELQQLRFEATCQLLLKATGLDHATCEAMSADPSHERWAEEEELDEEIQRLLGPRKYVVYRSHVELIAGVADEAGQQLRTFEVLKIEKQSGESWKQAFKRLSKPLKLAFNKSDIEKKILVFEKKNKNLECLLRLINRDITSTPPSTNVGHKKPSSSRLAKIREISKGIYKALTANFRCIDLSHHEHLVFLSLDVEFVNQLYLDMAISYMTSCTNGMTVEPPVRFRLSSRMIDAVPQLPAIASSQFTIEHTATPVQPLQESPKAANRKRKVAFTEQGESIPSTTSQRRCPAQIKGHDENQIGPTLNLGAVNGACQLISQRCRQTGAVSTWTASMRCADASQYEYFISPCAAPPQASGPVRAPKPTMSLEDYLRAESENVITIVQQFKIAMKMALAVLQYHSTPWLHEEWTLSQLQLMGAESGDTEELPLYLNLKLLGTGLANVSAPLNNADQDAAMIDDPKKTLSQAQRYGIDNVPLFCLGMALLQVGRWTPITELMDKQLDSNIVETVRREAQSMTKLGKKYDEIVRKCLRCDFGLGIYDLEKPELQKAVYSDIVSPLEELIAKLDGLKI